MNKTLSFMKLDYVTLRPYVTMKNLFIMIAVALFFTVQSNTSSISILMAYGFMFTGYPFAVGEKCNMDELYISLSISRNAVVGGRYLFTILMELCLGVFACLVSVLLSLLLHRPIEARETLIVVVTLFFVLSFLQTLQLPVFFKMGYAKGKMMTYMPLMVLAFLIIVISKHVSKVLSRFIEWLSKNPVTAITSGILIWLLTVLISYQIALKLYKKRDF